MATRPRARGSVKRVQIDKSQSTMLVASALAAFSLTFALVSGKMLVGQLMYQNKVINTKKTAAKQLKTNVQNSVELVNAYKAFVTTSKNALGGNPQGTGPQDGDNAKIILDALPSKYDFPALQTSLEKLMTGQNLKIVSMAGSDDEVAQAPNQSSPNPQPLPMTFQISAGGNYQSVQGLVDALNRSIRPFQIQKLKITGGEQDMTLAIDGQTYYQPAKNFNMTLKVVK